MTSRGLDLGKGPILPLLLKMSWPSVAAMLVAAVYNLMDTFWLARINPHAIAAFTVTFPIQMIFAAVGIGTGIGAGSFAARMFGAGKADKAQHAAGQVFLITAVFGMLIIISTLAYPDDILRFFGATEEILPLAKDYLVVAVLGSPLLLFMMICNNLIRAEGRPNLSMTVILSFAVTGSLLDPLLILGWGPFPRMGIVGAAVSACIAQFVGSLLSFIFLCRPTSKYHIEWRYLRPAPDIIYSIYQTGFPSVIMNLVISAVIVVYNHSLAHFGPHALATLGVCFRINGLVMMVLFGIGHGLMPMVGFNEGARHYGRLLETVRVAVRFSTIFAIICCSIMEIFAPQIMAAFTKDETLISIGVPALRIFVSTLPLIAPSLVWINMFLGLGKGTTSMLLMFVRDVFFLIPLLLLLPNFFGLNGIWMANPISSGIAFFVILVWAGKELRAIEAKAKANANAST